MKKIILILLASLMMMSGCTSEKLPKSDEEIQADCLKIQEIQSNLIELVSFKVNTRAFEGDYFVVKSTIELLTEKDDVKADVLMKYKKHTNTWFVDYSEINMISVISTEMPSESLILSVFNVDNDLPGRYEGSLFNKPTTLSLIDNPGNGTITYHFAQQEKNLIWTLDTYASGADLF